MLIGHQIEHMIKLLSRKFMSCKSIPKKVSASILVYCESVCQIFVHGHQELQQPNLKQGQHSFFASFAQVIEIGEMTKKSLKCCYIVTLESYLILTLTAAHKLQSSIFTRLTRDDVGSRLLCCLIACPGTCSHNCPICVM